MKTIDITLAVISEYEKLEASPRWFHSFLGDLYENEPEMGDWIRRSANGCLMALGSRAPSVFATVPPLAHDLFVIFEQWFARGYYMGIRKYVDGLTRDFGVVTPLTNSKPVNRQAKAEEPTWGEAEDLDEYDFDEPDVVRDDDEDDEVEGGEPQKGG